MKFQFIHIILFVLFSTVLNSQVSLKNYSNDQIVEAEFILHHFLEDYNLEDKISNREPQQINSDLDKQLYNELVNSLLPNKANVIKKLIDENLKKEDLASYFNSSLNSILNDRSFQVNFTSYKTQFQQNSQRGLNVTSRTAGQACVNIDFETGDYSGWEAELGRSCVGSAPDCYTFVANGSNPADPDNLKRHLLVGAGSDPSVPMLSTLSPFGGATSLRLGNQAAGYGAEKISHTFLVLPSQKIFTYAFAVVMQDPGTSHNIDYKPFFGIAMFDSNGISITDTCAQYNVAAGTGKPGFQTHTGGIEWKDWAQISIDLSPFVGQNVTIQFTTSDCDYGGHWGRAYIDASCSAPVVSILPSCEGMILEAPSGYFKYAWRELNSGLFVDSSQSITITGPGHYEVDLISENGCMIQIDTIISSLYFKLNHRVTTKDLLCFNDSSGELNVIPFGGISPYSYSINNDTNFQTSTNFSGLSAGTYSLIIKDSYGCSDTSYNHLVSEPPVLGLDIVTIDASCYNVCDGESTVVTYGGTQINGNYLYSWNGEPNTFSNSINGLCANTHTLKITDLNGCFIDTTFDINEPPPTTLSNVVVTDELCYNSCLGGITINEPTAIQFSIDGGNTYQTSGVYNNLCAVASPYYLIVRDAAGCVIRDTVIINQPQPTTLTASNDTLICYGASASLVANMGGGTPGYTYTWYEGINQVFVGSPFIASPLTLTNYTVIATDANGCQMLEGVTVNVLTPLEVAAFSDESICEGDSIEIFAIGSGGIGTYNYSWNNGGGNTQYTTVSPVITTTYTVTVSDGCSSPNAQDSILITVNPLPDVSFTSDTTEGCVPTRINFTNLTPPATVNSCFWEFGDGGVTTICGQVSHIYEDTGRYDVRLTITSPYGCVSDSLAAGMIWIHPNPVPDFIADPFFTDVWHPEVVFTNTSILNDFNYWTYDVFANSTNVDSTITFPIDQGGEYNICLDIETAYGCVDDICKKIVVKDKSYLFVPNSFTPDGDEVNDKFFPVVNGIDENDFVFYVFNRWGELIFRTEHFENHWDGTFKGELCKEDVYVWKVEARSLETGNLIEKIGHVSLLK